MSPANPSDSVIHTALHVAASFTDAAWAFRLKMPRSIASTARTPILNAIKSAVWLTDALSRSSGFSLLRRWSAALQRITNIEKGLEIQLLSAICEVERGHLALVARFLRALKGFAVHLV